MNLSTNLTGKAGGLLVTIEVRNTFFLNLNSLRSSKLGVDALSWEYFAERMLSSVAAQSALAKNNLTVAPMIDWEIVAKLNIVAKNSNYKSLADFDSPNSIKPDNETVHILIDSIKEFYNSITDKLLAKDGKGRDNILVFGFGFDDTQLKPALWDIFAHSLISQTNSLYKNQVAFYWTSTNSKFQGHLFLHYRDSFVPYHVNTVTT